MLWKPIRHYDADHAASSISGDDLRHIIGLYGSSVEDIFEPGAGAMLPYIVEPQQLQQAIEKYIAAGGDPAKVEAFIQKSTDGE